VVWVVGNDSLPYLQVHSDRLEGTVPSLERKPALEAAEGLLLS
jgi:hypothetical protein